MERAVQSTSRNELNSLAMGANNFGGGGWVGTLAFLLFPPPLPHTHTHTHTSQMHKRHTVNSGELQIPYPVSVCVRRNFMP